LVTLVRLALLDLLFHFRELRVKLPYDVLFLLLPQLVHSHSNVIYLIHNLFLEFLVDMRVFYVCIFLETQPDSQFVLEFVDVLAILEFTLAVSIFPTPQILLYFLVFINLSIQEN